VPTPDPPAPAAGAQFSARGLACRRGLRDVFRGVAFDLAAGDALVLTGPNGSGKSSLLRVLAGLTPAAAGQVLWSGKGVGEDPDGHRARLSYLGHADAVKPALTAAENLAFWIALGGAEAPGRRDRALERFGLARLADMPARYLSAGQRRRLSLARVAALPRALWLLDEPSVGLDEQAQGALVAAVEEHRQAGGIAVVSTHAPLALAGARSLDLARFAPGPAA
jgi:heme exporter protein A